MSHLCVSYVNIFQILVVVVVVVVVVNNDDNFSVVLVVYRDHIHKCVTKVMVVPRVPSQHKQSMLVRVESQVPPNGKMYEIDFSFFK